ncbi:MAG: TIGR00282 family metallophosphoesterase [Bdellovibrionota bacterium]
MLSSSRYTILMVGDVFGQPGQDAIKGLLPRLIDQHEIDFVVVNGENANHGRGLTKNIAESFFQAGADVVTTGNHYFNSSSMFSWMDKDLRLIRPINYGEKVSGYGSTILQSRRCNLRVGVINAVGKFMMANSELPYDQVVQEAEHLRSQCDCIVVDFHAEATSEKRLMGWLLDGKVSAVCGTHTHVQTADEQILPQGTAYMTDLGMTGPHQSVIGLEVDVAYKRLTGSQPHLFEVATQDVRLCGALIEVEASNPCMHEPSLDSTFLFDLFLKIFFILFSCGSF